MDRAREKKPWYRLDNAGKLYPAITSTQITSVFRVSATLTDPVDSKRLGQALSDVSGRFPTFAVFLKRGLFWYYYERAGVTPEPEEEAYFPCMFLRYKMRGVMPFRVLYFKRKISLEVSHSITDGTGAMTFLKSLLLRYFELDGVMCKDAGTVVRHDSPPVSGETEDAFQHHAVTGLPDPPHLDKAFVFKSPTLPKGEYLITTGIVDVTAILEKARKIGCTVTQFFLALFFDTIQDYIALTGRKGPQPVVINVPVNLRGLFPSNTMRNFFTGINPTVDFRLGSYSFEELVTLVGQEMKSAITEKNLARLISYNVRQERRFLVRIVPLWLKKHILRFVYRKYGEKRMTSNLSNLGDVAMPEELLPLIERFEFYPPPSAGIMKKISMLSFKGRMYLSFGSQTADKTIETLFFRKLRKMGIHVKIESNGA